MSLDVIGFGESSVDHVHVVAELPGGTQSKVGILSSHVSYGGQVATTMAACATLGLNARYLGPVGNDADAERLVAALLARNVDVSGVLRRRAPTRYALILVHHSTGERFVLFGRDPALNVHPTELSPESIARARVVHVDATDPDASLRLTSIARDAGALVTTDVDLVTDATARLLAAATTPIVAEGVPRELTGESDLPTALRRMRQPHQRTVCVTRGERGSAALDGDDVIFVPAPEVQAVDTTGAGDVFRAGFIYGLVRGWPIRSTLEFANATAAVACTRPGAIASVPTLDDVRSLVPSLSCLLP